jgi:DNA-binding NarL/FixJ family response regulator
MNGIDASRVLKTPHAHGSVVMFTTFADPHLKNAALAAGVHDAIDKSESAALIESIKHFLWAELPPPSNAAA